MKFTRLSWSVLASMVTLAGCLQHHFPREISSSSPTARDTPVEIPLEVFQIQAPVRDNYDGALCSQTIVQNDFTFSYDKPFIGTYNPPTNCAFTTIVFNLTITSIGINFDRISLLYLGDIEVWRATTGMPVRTGIYYTYTKDMTAYTPLLRQQQKVILQLENLYDSVFTGNFNVTITALYYNDGAIVHPADAILPISSLSSSENRTSVFSLPEDDATVALTFPRNVERAVVSVFASGSGREEFWYTDVPVAVNATFNNTFSNGYSPWREVQVRIDGVLAGFVSPFPVIFTGGINTGFWVPIVGVDTYDLGSVDIDVSPWLGILCDGNAHDFELKVIGLRSADEFGTTAKLWYVSAQVFVWLDEEGIQTTASDVIPLYAEEVQPNALINYELETSSNGTNSSLYVGVAIDRAVAWSANVTTSKGTSNVTWTQAISYENHQNFTAAGSNETLYQSTTGRAVSQVTSTTTGVTDTAELEFDYPLSFYQAYAIARGEAITTTNSTLYAVLDRGKHETGRSISAHLLYDDSPESVPSPSSPEFLLSTRQNGTCFYIWNNTYYANAGAIDPAEGTYGATAQWFTWAGVVPSQQGGALGLAAKNYSRFARAIDGYEPVLVVDEVLDERIAVPRTELVAGEGINVLPPVLSLSDADADADSSLF